MLFKPAYKEAVIRKNYFLTKSLFDYSKKRNFDYGYDNRNNISCLSPYISHQVIDELELINECINKFEYNIDGKFITELFWRIYWKGNLELKPSIWSSYKKSLNFLRNEFKNNEFYLNAINGNTNINCFNEWVFELKKYGYLHNHTRMWFSSIWVFTFNLPWQLGAEFFLRHLYDGDYATNTLSWRWVAGLHTKNKYYLAKVENIRKFSNKSISESALKEFVNLPNETEFHPVEKNGFLNPEISGDRKLLIFENSLNVNRLLLYKNKFKHIFIVYTGNELREIKLDNNILNFKKELINDFYMRISKDFEVKILDITELDDSYNGSYAFYPNVGCILDVIRRLNLKFIYRKIDITSWGKCDGGFFRFKKFIPRLIESLSK